MIKLFIVGIPRDMDEVELTEIVADYGQVYSVKIITDQETHVSKGYGFITMLEQHGADRVLTGLNGATIDERTITVRYADKPVEQPAPREFKRPQGVGMQQRGTMQNAGQASARRGKRPRKAF